MTFAFVNLRESQVSKSPRQPPWKSEAYRPDIDGLRAISILAVLFYHAFPTTVTSGFVGVDIFFVISGYLIGGLITSELSAGKFSLINFYERRIRRIFPSLILVCLSTYVIGWAVMFPVELSMLGKHLVGAAAFVTNFVLLNEVGYFDAEAHAKPLLHLWSLAIEEQFYLLWPLFAMLTWRRRRLFLLATLIFALSSFASNVSHRPASDAFYLPWTRFWELAIGVLAAHIPRSTVNAILGTAVFRQAACAIGLVLIGIAVFCIPVAVFPGWWSLLPVIGAALVIVSAPGTIAGRWLLSIRPMVFVGRISYPLYLWHWPLFSFAWLKYGSSPPESTTWQLIALSVCLAYLTFRFVENPVRFGVKKGRIALSLVSAVLALAAMGTLTMALKGMPQREGALANRSLAENIRIPTDSRTSDGSCERQYGIATGDAYVCFVNSPDPEVLYVGDSVTMAFYSAIQAKIVNEKSVLLAAHSFQWRKPECLSYGSFDEWLRGSSTCQDVIRNLLEIVGRQQSLKVVVIPTYSQNPFFSVQRNLEQLQSAILALGKKVVYVTSVPQMRQAPQNCWPRKFELLGVDFSHEPYDLACREPRAGVEAVLQQQKQLFEKMAHQKADVFVFDSLPSFCDAEVCDQSDKEGLLFWSWAHINERGSARVLANFLPWLHSVVLK